MLDKVYVHSDIKPIVWPILLWDVNEDVGKYYHPTNLAACHMICAHDKSTETGIYAVKYPPFQVLPFSTSSHLESFA